MLTEDNYLYTIYIYLQLSSHCYIIKDLLILNYVISQQYQYLGYL